MGLIKSHKNKIDELRKGVRRATLLVNRGKEANRQNVAKGFKTRGARFEMLNSNTKLRPSKNAYAALEARHTYLSNPREGLFAHKLTRNNHHALDLTRSHLAILRAKILGWEAARRHWQETRQTKSNGENLLRK
jgi:hypothetical protein